VCGLVTWYALWRGRQDERRRTEEEERKREAKRGGSSYWAQWLSWHGGILCFLKPKAGV